MEPHLPVENLPNLIETALRAENPEAALQRLGAYLLEMGVERDALLPALQHHRDWLIHAGRADDADHLAGMMDGFTGWCSLNEQR